MTAWRAMERIEITPRLHWRRIAEDRGFQIHTLFGRTYWNESACYRFTREAIERDLHGATSELSEMCLFLVDRAIRDDEVLSTLGIPERWWDRVRQSRLRGEAELLARYDLAYDGTGPAKLLECNADCAGILYETGFFQWLWLEDLIAGGQIPAGSDQDNRLHEQLVAALARRGPMGSTLHVTASGRNAEDRLAAAYLADCALQAGRQAILLDIEDIGIDARGRLTDLDDRPIAELVKFYRWDRLIEEPFADALAGPGAPVMIEPCWKMILASKGILPWLWRLFPGHPNLLPARFADAPGAPGSGDAHVTKPLRSIKGANIRISAPHHPVGEVETGGPYADQPRVVQAYHPLPTFIDASRAAHHAQIGAWTVAGRPAGLCVIEDDGPIVRQESERMVPHVVLP